MLSLHAQMDLQTACGRSLVGSVQFEVWSLVSVSQWHTQRVQYRRFALSSETVADAVYDTQDPPFVVRQLCPATVEVDPVTRDACLRPGADSDVSSHVEIMQAPRWVCLQACRYINTRLCLRNRTDMSECGAWSRAMHCRANRGVPGRASAGRRTAVSPAEDIHPRLPY